jgi:hypothetical protein
MDEKYHLLGKEWNNIDESMITAWTGTIFSIVKV